MCHIAVIIEMIARQVSERRSGDAHTIEPKLI